MLLIDLLIMMQLGKDFFFVVLGGKFWLNLSRCFSGSTGHKFGLDLLIWLSAKWWLSDSP